MASAALEQAFALTAGELGMVSASWLFAREVAAAEGLPAVSQLRDDLGRRWPVLDAVCAAFVLGESFPHVKRDGVLQRLQGFRRLLIVGLESHWLDALLAGLPVDLRVGLLRHSDLSPDWNRVQANLGQRISLVDLSDFQLWAGSRSAILSFVYGAGLPGAHKLFATSAWARAWGPDTRTQFRELIGWDVLGVPLSVYPRWLVSVPKEQFTAVEAGH